MTEKITQLEQWFNAAKTAFKMGTQKADSNTVILLGAHRRLMDKIEKAKRLPQSDGVKATVAQYEADYASFIAELRGELQMFDLICKRFNTDLYPQIKIGDDVKIYVAMSADRAGAAVMAMTFLHLSRCFTVKDMVANFIPSGFPGEDSLGLIWGIQKMTGVNFTGNLVDDIESVNSLYNKMYGSGDK